MNKDSGIFSLKDKVIIVTGGTGRYGYHFCEALAEAGGTVILTSRDKKRAEKKVEALTEKGLKVFGYSLDLSQDDSIDEFVAKVIREHKKINVLINNARVIVPVPHYKMTRENFEESFATNIIGLMMLTRRVVEEMKKAGKGNIINISSIYGIVGQNLSIYADPEENISLDYPIQKGGMITYTKQLATVLGQHNIRANCLSLGGIEAPGLDPDFVERYSKRLPLGRMTKGEDVFGPIVFLASDSSAYMTGANLVVDGGWTAW